MKELLDRIHFVLTGKWASEAVDQNDIGVKAAGILDGCLVVMGRDRFQGNISPDFFPMIVLERGTESGSLEWGESCQMTVNVHLGVAVRERFSSLFGRRQTNYRGILELVELVKQVLAENADLRVTGKGPYTRGISGYSVNPEIMSDRNGWVTLLIADMAFTYDVRQRQPQKN